MLCMVNILKVILVIYNFHLLHGHSLHIHYYSILHCFLITLKYGNFTSLRDGNVTKDRRGTDAMDQTFCHPLSTVVNIYLLRSACNMPARWILATEVEWILLLS